jgi:hypothetical protein
MGTGRCLSDVRPKTKEKMTMHLFGDHQRLHDPLWDVASATQVLVGDPTTVTGLARETEGECDAAVDGVLVAVAHPTGWFVHAVRRDDLPDAQLGAFRELVKVRTYLLLAQGPQAPAWRAAPIEGEWRSVSLSLARELAELDDALVD